MNNVLNLLNKMGIDIAYLKGVVGQQIVDKVWKDLSETHPHFASRETYEDLRVLSFVSCNGPVLTRFPVDFVSAEWETTYRGEQSLEPVQTLKTLRAASGYTDAFLARGEMKMAMVEAISRMAKNKLTVT